MQALSGFLTDTTDQGAMETWLYNPLLPNGTAPLNHFVEVTPDYKWLYQLTIAGQFIAVDMYPMNQISGASLAAIFGPTSRHYFTFIPQSLLPLQPWTHVVIQGNRGVSGSTPPELWLNGTRLSVFQGPLPIGSWSVATTTAGGMVYPDSLNTLKHLRLYTRKMYPWEIWQNAHNNCLMPAQTPDLWFRFNLPAPGSITTEGFGSTAEKRVPPVYPQHTLPSSYAYNSTNQVLQQQSPDGGTNRFWYDMLSRLNVSQNDKQLAAGAYSYTLYDALGRIIEVGQKGMNTVNLPSAGYLDSATLARFNYSGTNSQITNTYYDAAPQAGYGIHALSQNNLRKRVALSTYRDAATDTVKQATYYNYDLDGNVQTLYQQVAGLGIKRMDYEYDLISGKVNFVRYQDGKPDQFYYKYYYDADNRLTDAWSGIKAVVDTAQGSVLLPGFNRQDAHYAYYLHGPLARQELGDQYGKVQGIDYAYTLQGWLKGVNGSTLNNDVGQDGAPIGGLAGTIPKDAYAYSLGYYSGDYKPIGGTNAPAFNTIYQSNAGDITGQSLYNGNISNTTLAISSLNSGAAVGYTYHYDQLNRLKAMRQHNLSGSSTWNSSSMIQDYAENATYDGNGNILSYLRNGNSTTGLPMDNLTYHYNHDASGNLQTNRLRQINDAVPSNNGYTADLKDQSDTANYTYDQIGNLIHDTQAGITNIDWTVYGKIWNIYKGTGNINYSYSPAGQRVSKTYNGVTTYYVRDAQGNTLALYDNSPPPGGGGGGLNWREQDLYGSSRLGMWRPNVNLASNNAATVYDTIGNKFFELSNHLGNVLATITDKRLQNATGGNVLSYYTADVATAQDYYPFGMTMPGRTYTANSLNYRYGFNGKENDNDIGHSQNYGEREYDFDDGRFWSVDPLAREYPELSPYQFASNNPIANIDLDGLEAFNSNTKKSFIGAPVIAKTTQDVVIKKVEQQVVKQGVVEGGTSLLPEIGGYFGAVVGVFIPVPNDKNSAEAVWMRQRGSQSAMSNHLEYHTDDPSTLSDEYLYQVRERLATGKAYQSDYRYAKEANARFGGQSASDVPKGRGVVYLRIDKTGVLKPYIGQAESASRYKQRQKEHERANPDAVFEFEIIVTGVPGNDLTRKEQQAIDAFGGVTNKKNPDGGTSNQRNPGKSLPKQNTDGGN